MIGLIRSRLRAETAPPRLGDVAPRHRVYPAVLSSGVGAHWRPPPSRGPAQTRSRAGQPAQAKSLGVGRKSPAAMRPIASDSSASSASVSARVNVAETTSSGRSRNW